MILMTMLCALWLALGLVGAVEVYRWWRAWGFRWTAGCSVAMLSLLWLGPVLIWMFRDARGQAGRGKGNDHAHHG